MTRRDFFPQTAIGTGNQSGKHGWRRGTEDPRGYISSQEQSRAVRSGRRRLSPGIQAGTVYKSWLHELPSVIALMERYGSTMDENGGF